MRSLKSWRRRSSRMNRKLAQATNSHLEMLESRQLLSLIGVVAGFPQVDLDTDSSTISYNYNPSTSQGQITASAGDLNITFNSGSSASRIAAGVDGLSFTMDFLLNSSGNVVSGQTGPNLVFDGAIKDPNTGKVDNGLLLEGTISQFGYQYSGLATPTVNNFDATFIPTGGLLESYFSGQYIGVSFLSENNTFNGSFTTNWSGGGNGSQGVDGVAGPYGISSPPPPSIDTTPGGTVVLGSGTPLTDTAILSNGDGETGSITFSLYNSNNVVVDTEIVPVSGPGTYTTPTGYVPTGSGTLTGTYQWVASYSGDANNSPVSSPEGSEPEAVAPASPSITTTPSQTTVALGTSSVTLNDTAVFSGGVNETGSITFNLVAPGGTTVDTEVVSVNGAGSYTTPNGYLLPTAAAVTGTYQWDANYSGDANNNSASDESNANEQVTVSPAGPTINTTPSQTTVTLGTTTVTLKDTADLEGGYSPTGTIVFSLIGPGNVTEDTETVSVNGNGMYSTPTGCTLPASGTVTGTYQWDAVYSGDDNNKPATDEGNSNEQVTVSPATPSITTTPSLTTVTLGTSLVTLNDTALLSGGYDETGTITFTLIAPGGAIVDSETVGVTGNGSYSTVTGYVLPTAAAATGTYQWDATYNGDANNNSVSDVSNADEQVTVSPATPAINTTPSQTTVTLGTNTVTLDDTADLTGGYSPTGTIVFTLIAPGGATVDTETVTVNGIGDYTTPTGYTLPTAVAVTGVYQWDASYSGDANNNSVSEDTSVSEQTTVSPATPEIDTTPAGTIVIGSGNALTDTAVLSGGYSPTGTITFTLYSPGDVVVDSETVTVNGNGSYTTPNGFIPTATSSTGTYEWAASYSGDNNNNAVSSPQTAELETVTPATPEISTIPGGTIVIGSGTALTDTAVLNGGVSPTGTITFTLYSPADVVVDTETVTVNGNGTYTTPNGFIPTATSSTGTYEWAASYSGDNNNISVSSPQTAELETVSPATPAINTTPSLTSVTLGTSTVNLKDTAQLSGGYDETGTITFTLIAPGGATVDTETVTVSGIGNYTTPIGYTTPTVGTVTGTYQWDASYSGDSNNNAVSDNNAADEQVVVSPATPAITTIPGGSLIVGSGTDLNDSAMLTGGYNPTGTITFYLFAPGVTPNGNDSNSVYSDTITVAGNGTYTTAGGTNPGGYLPIETGTYQWVALYGGDTNNSAATSPFGSEPETVSPATPAITTTPSLTTVTLGTNSVILKDTAVLSGGFNDTGSITFTLYNGSTLVDTETATVSGSGSYTTPSGYTLPNVGTVTGTYQWDASYSGDSNNNAVSETGQANEQVVVSPASPAINTTPCLTTVTLGISTVTLKDTAQLSGGYDETGTITFTLIAPGGATIDTETVTVNGNGNYTTPTGYILSASGGVAGTYQWDASYNGDSNNHSVSENNAANEQVVVSPASPQITTTPGGTIVIGSGSKLTDTAVLSGGVSPTGTITFTLYSPSNAVVDTETVTVNGNGSYSTQNGFVPTATSGIGTYEWAASYSGDSNNKAVSSPKTAELECVTAASPAINTTPGGTITLGSGVKLTDTATLSGGFSETGSITFTLYSPANVIVDTETVTVTGNASYTTPNGFAPTAATGVGTYEWAAAYSGDSNNKAVSSPKTAELEIVTQASPAITTTPGGTIVIGSGNKLTDSAILSGGVGETGTITFTLYSPSNAVVDTETVTVNGNGTYSTPNGYVPTVVGAYEWAAAYSGDTNNKAVSSPKTAESESVTCSKIAINTTPGGTIVIGSGGTLTDTATLSGGYNETGTIVFTLYSPGNAVVDTVTVTVSGNGSYSTPTGYVPTAVGTYEWAAAYSGDSNNAAVSSPKTAEQECVTPASPTIVTTPGGTVTLGAITISGTKYLDLTGNGFSSDDTPQAGVTIDLYESTNGTAGLQVGSGGDFLVATATTSSNGSYSFTVPNAGTYYVQESVPTGYIQTGGGPDGSAGDTYYTINATGGHSYSGNNFDDYLVPTCTPTNVSFKVTTPSGSSQTVTTLSGNTQQGDTVTATFTVPAGMDDTLTLVSYTAPSSTWSDANAYEQVIYQQATGTFTPGTHTLTVQIPNDDYQIDFFCGAAIGQLEPNQNNDAYGPDSADITYHAEDRFISSDNGGTKVCSPMPAPTPATPIPQSSPTTATMVLSDSATLSGGYNPTGSITFTLYSPTNTVVDTETVTVSGNGTYNTPNGYAPTTAGTYEWVATYTGDGNNNSVTSPKGSEPEVVTQASVNCQSTAFWCCSSGQSLLCCLNGGSSCTNLGNWLCNSFGNLWGKTCGSNCLSGKTNSQICSYFQGLCDSPSTQCNAQLLAAAFNCYVTNSSNCGTVACSYGFNVNSSGCGSQQFNVGGCGSTFGVSNNSCQTVNQLLQSCNSQSKNGSIFNGSGSCQSSACSVFTACNEAGCIGGYN
jgi:hypothetical protein